MAEDLVLSTQFNNQTILYEEGSVDAITAGLLEEATLAFDRHSTIEIQGRLFRGASPFGLDLIAIDIQRGRDHGLGTFNDVRHACGKERARHFADLEDSMTPENIAVLQGLYRHVDDIDFMVGGMMEVPLTKDAAVGPAFGCVISLEFRSKRISDRYWHENPTQFPLDLLNQMRRITMAEILCQTTGLRKVPLNAFRVPSDM
ncbi:hypothetical protein RvY_04222 [Ramazzottius varieornatus]|uniref:Peroxidase n=1 Tax=Ramazzottius varieornatus TaxID=947166 RepID=A0A1D1V067_RAMVA|nr:hypothetical protein RvY_04222 [Ramazzottius varieornatus]